MSDNSRMVSETLGTGQYVDAPFGGTVKDIHTSCRDEIERLRQLMEAFISAWERSELGENNGTEYFNAVHAMRMNLKDHD